MKPAILIMALVLTLVVQAQERKLNLTEMEPSFRELLKELRIAVSKRDPFPIFRSISKNFSIERDFGGLARESENAIVNFLLVYALDDFEIRAEYRDEGWQHLALMLASNTIIIRDETAFCLSHGPYQNKLSQDELLCFSKAVDDHWQIKYHVFAGD